MSRSWSMRAPRGRWNFNTILESKPYCWYNKTRPTTWDTHVATEVYSMAVSHLLWDKLATCRKNSGNVVKWISTEMFGNIADITVSFTEEQIAQCIMFNNNQQRGTCSQEGSGAEARFLNTTKINWPRFWISNLKHLSFQFMDKSALRS